MSVLNFDLPSTSSIAESNCNQSNEVGQGQHRTFENDCMNFLDDQYPHWKTNGWGFTPICIPEAIEVSDKYFIGPIDPKASDYDAKAIKKHDRKLRGDDAERMVLSAFQSSKVGGILFQSIDMGMLWKKFSGNNKKNCCKKISFEIDSLFFHPKLGIVILETKSFHHNKNENEEEPQTEKEKKSSRRAIKRCYKKARKQVSEIRPKLLEIYEILTNTKCTIDISHVICLPNAAKEDIHSDAKCPVLDNVDLLDQTRFHEFWEEKVKNNQNFFEDPSFCRFIAIICGYRASKFTSAARNAIEIHRMIKMQESCRNLKHNCGITSREFLNTKQWNVYDIATQMLEQNQNSLVQPVHKNLIIFGPPGSGKSLLVMLLAKKAAEMQRSGKVLIFLPTNSLAMMYKKFFEANKRGQKRAIIINPLLEDIRKATALDSYDDVFADEDLSGAWITRTRRPNAITIIAITTGRFYEPAAALLAKKHLEKQLEVDNFHIFQLVTVMRNTKKISDYYCSKFLPQDNPFVIGHNIHGRNVVELKVDSMESACCEIYARIEQFLNNPPASSERLLRRQNIAVIVCHEPVNIQVQLIKNYLQRSGINTGSIVEQLESSTSVSNSDKVDRTLVAVDCSTNALSFEWCAVFVIDASNCYYSKHLAHPVVACSRATSSLIVINTVDCGTQGKFLACDIESQRDYRCCTQLLSRWHPSTMGRPWECGKFRRAIVSSGKQQVSLARDQRRENFLRESWGTNTIICNSQLLRLQAYLLFLIIALLTLNLPTGWFASAFKPYVSFLVAFNFLLLITAENYMKLNLPKLNRSIKLLGALFMITTLAFTLIFYDLVRLLLIVCLSLFIFLPLHGIMLAAVEFVRQAGHILWYTLNYVLIPAIIVGCMCACELEFSYAMAISFELSVMFLTYSSISVIEPLECTKIYP